MSTSLERLSRWFKSQCDGLWEHDWSVRIETLDNPGWLVKINLAGTTLEQAEFKPIATDRSPADWVNCSVQMQGRIKGNPPTRTFIGAGGVRNLEEIVTIFCDWAEKHIGAPRRPSRPAPRRRR